MRFRSLATASLSTALIIGAVAPVAAQDDPADLLVQAAQATMNATSFHFAVTVDGSASMGESMGGQSLSLAGTHADGDVSVNPLAVSITFEAPITGLSADGGLLIPNDGNAYLKLNVMGMASELWSKIPLGEINAPTAIPTLPPDAADQIRKEIADSGATVSIVGDAACSAGTCTQLHLELPGDAVGDVANTEAPTIPVELFIDKATSRLDSVSTHIVDASSGMDVTVVVTLSAFDEPVSVQAPAADQVTDQLPAILQMFMGGSGS